MADIADDAANQEAVITEAARLYRKPEGPQATGFCLNCDAILPPGHRWCDAECRDDWQLRKDRGDV